MATQLRARVALWAQCRRVVKIAIVFAGGVRHRESLHVPAASTTAGTTAPSARRTTRSATHRTSASSGSMDNAPDASMSQLDGQIETRSGEKRAGPREEPSYNCDNSSNSKYRAMHLNLASGENARCSRREMMGECLRIKPIFVAIRSNMSACTHEGRCWNQQLSMT